MAIVINGKQLAELVLEKLTKEFSTFDLGNRYSAIIQVGNDEATNIYIRNKTNAGKKVGLTFKNIQFNLRVSKNELVKEITKLNTDKNCIGMLIQSPLPSSLNLEEISDYITPTKDIDCMSSFNIGKISTNDKPLLPATVSAVVKILEYVSGLEKTKFKDYVKGKNVAIINNTIILGKPLSAYLTSLNSTVVICNKYTKDMDKLTRQADILVSATGVIKLVNADIVKKDSLVIDCGISKLNNTIYGDIDFERVIKKAKYITPVPGGVGPLTVVSLLENQLILLKNAKNN